MKRLLLLALVTSATSTQADVVMPGDKIYEFKATVSGGLAETLYRAMRSDKKTDRNSLNKVAIDTESWRHDTYLTCSPTSSHAAARCELMVHTINRDLSNPDIMEKVFKFSRKDGNTYEMQSYGRGFVFNVSQAIRVDKTNVDENKNETRIAMDHDTRLVACTPLYGSADCTITFQSDLDLSKRENVAKILSFKQVGRHVDSVPASNPTKK